MYTVGEFCATSETILLVRFLNHWMQAYSSRQAFANICAAIRNHRWENIRNNLNILANLFLL